MSARISLYQNKVKKEIEQGNENKKGFQSFSELIIRNKSYYKLNSINIKICKK